MTYTIVVTLLDGTTETITGATSVNDAYSSGLLVRIVKGNDVTVYNWKALRKIVVTTVNPE